MENIIIGILILACGIFTIFCAAKDYDWFMNHRKAKLFVAIFGRGGARVVYVLLGLVLTVVSLFVIFMGDKMNNA